MPKPDFSDLESRVRELVDREERTANRAAQKKGWGRWLFKKILLWLFLLMTMSTVVVCGDIVRSPKLTKMCDWVKASMIRASQISWGESSASPKAARAAPDDNTVIIEQLSQQIFEMNGALMVMQQKWAEINTQNETLAAELASIGLETSKKIKELENMVEILGKKSAVKPARKNLPPPLLLTEPEGQRSYHAPTQASQDKSKSAFVINKEGNMVRTDEL